MEWAKQRGAKLDFNPTFFSHPLAEDGMTLSSTDKGIRNFWVEHGKRCREIAQAMAKYQDAPCVINFWMPDGMKDTPADAFGPRARMVEALDEIFAEEGIDNSLVLDAVESKLFGLGLEAYTVGSHEFMMGYAMSRGKIYTMDAGHFHPTETVSGKISAILQFMPTLLLHVSRPMRWDSDHVVRWDDELTAIMHEIVSGHAIERVKLALDYFDASINRVAAWVIGQRNAQKALLFALMNPEKALNECEASGDFTGRLALQEELRTLPFDAVWNYYCYTQNVPVGTQWISDVKRYEKTEMLLRG